MLGVTRAGQGAPRWSVDGTSEWRSGSWRRRQGRRQKDQWIQTNRFLVLVLPLLAVQTQLSLLRIFLLSSISSWDRRLMCPKWSTPSPHLLHSSSEHLTFCCICVHPLSLLIKFQLMRAGELCIPGACVIGERSKCSLKTCRMKAHTHPMGKLFGNTS